MSGFLTSMIQWLVTVLPADPLQAFIRGLSLPYLGWLNLLMPFGTFVNILYAWTGAISVWYLWSSLARFLHMID